MQIKQGDLYWPNLEQTIIHPVVVIREDTDTVVVCALTTNTKKATIPGNVVLDDGEGKLDKQSIIEASKVLILNKQQLGEYIGSLNKKRVEEILEGIGFIHRSFLNSRNPKQTKNR